MAVLTGKKLDKMIEEGGIGYWKADARRVAQCLYILAIANARSGITQFSSADQNKGYLLGRIAGTFRPPEHPDRLVIVISEYAEIDLPNAWPGYRNPVFYTDLETLGIDARALDWKTFPFIKRDDTANDTVQALSVVEAKLGLAKKFGVNPDQIEIIIRG
ncbi:hypothetical protein [Acidihalobacter ferrooxydans]|nr:hypothetical protein [Acidihalobacter ferrooxydans]